MGSPFGDVNGDGKGRSYIARRPSVSVASPKIFVTGGWEVGLGMGIVMGMAVQVRVQWV